MTLITPATEEDISKIIEIEREAISPPWTHGALLSEIYKDDSFFIIAVDDTGEPSPCVAGFAIIRQVGDDGELLQIAVDKNQRRLGVGDLLMEAVVAYAWKNTCNSIFLEVRRGNKPAVSLYEKHGFKSVRIRRDYYSDPVEDALVMTKPLLR